MSLFHSATKSLLLMAFCVCIEGVGVLLQSFLFSIIQSKKQNQFDFH